MIDIGDNPEQQVIHSAEMRRLQNDRVLRASEVDNLKPQWQERGIIDVPVHELPAITEIHGPEDFKKVPEEEMVDGLKKLSLMKYEIDAGAGNSSDYWRSVDEKAGLNYENGCQRVYDAFYGDDAIRLNKIGDEYEVINGRHRIQLAKQLGYRTLPASVNELQQ